jgi:hypothetical protein
MKKTEMSTWSEKHKDEKRYTENQTDSFNAFKDKEKVSIRFFLKLVTEVSLFEWLL